jgi:hypothetical protein
MHAFISSVSTQIADPLSTGASVAFIHLAGQLLQGTWFLVNFFSALKDTPDDVKALQRELVLLQATLWDTDKLLTRLQGFGHGSVGSGLEIALNQCKTASINCLTLSKNTHPRRVQGDGSVLGNRSLPRFAPKTFRNIRKHWNERKIPCNMHY